MQQCEKSACFATSLTADHSKVWRSAMRPRPTLPPLSYVACDISYLPARPMSVICPAITWHGTQCTPFILLQYQVTQTNVTCQWPTAANHHAADIICLLEKFVAHMLTICNPHISWPFDFELANLSQIFRLVCEYIRYIQKDPAKPVSGKHSLTHTLSLSLLYNVFNSLIHFLHFLRFIASLLHICWVW